MNAEKHVFKNFMFEYHMLKKFHKGSSVMITYITQNINILWEILSDCTMQQQTKLRKAYLSNCTQIRFYKRAI